MKGPPSQARHSPLGAFSGADCTRSHGEGWNAEEAPALPRQAHGPPNPAKFESWFLSGGRLQSGIWILLLNFDPARFADMGMRFLGRGPRSCSCRRGDPRRGGFSRGGGLTSAGGQRLIETSRPYVHKDDGVCAHVVSAF